MDGRIKIPAGVSKPEVLLALYNHALYQGSDEAIRENVRKSFAVGEGADNGLKTLPKPYCDVSVTSVAYLIHSIKRGAQKGRPGQMKSALAELNEREKMNPPDYNFDEVDLGSAPRRLMICFTGPLFDEFDPTAYNRLHGVNAQEIIANLKPAEIDYLMLTPSTPMFFNKSATVVPCTTDGPLVSTPDVVENPRVEKSQTVRRLSFTYEV